MTSSDRRLAHWKQLQSCPRSASMSKKAVGKVKLSFDPDEEEEENEDSFQVKKSKESRKFKKMRQAPGISDAVQVEDSAVRVTVTEVGGSYSAESLAQLKKAQLFVKHESTADPAPANGMSEGVELSGEAAEEFVELTERLAMAKNNNLGEYVSFDGGSADVDAIHAARLVNKTLLKGSADSDRIYTSAVSKADKRVAFDLAQDNDSDWEQEIINRGVINKTALSKRNADVTEKLQQQNQISGKGTAASLNSSSSSTIGEITVVDLMKSVQLAVDKLTHNSDAASRRIEQIEVDITASAKEETKLRSQVEVGVKKLNTVQDMRYFFASLVGMLRDKSSNIKELSAAQLTSVKEHLELVKQRRIDEQEDTLYRIKEAGLMISIGGYTPAGILSAPAPGTTDNAATNSIPQVDEFGRVKAEVASLDPKFGAAALKRREERRLKERVSLAETAEHLTASDREYLIANRICDIAAGDGVKDALYAALENRSVLYNSKGVEVEFQQKWDTLKMAAVAVVDDVEPELLSVATIIQKLLQFRETYSSEFQAAFIADSVAELLQPLIQLDLIQLTDALFTRNSNSSNHNCSSSGTNGSDDKTWKSRTWYAPLKTFSEQVEPTGHAGAGASASGGTLGSMSSMAARINNLFQEDEQEDRKATLLTQIADGPMLAWLKEQVGSAFDPFSSSQCECLAALMTELKELCSVKVARDFHQLVVTDTERVFAEALRGICLPLLKGARSGETNAPGQVGAEFARAYTVQQLRRVLCLLKNAFVFRTSKLLKAEWAAKWAWLALTEQCLPCALKLFKAGVLQDKILVLDICSAVLSLITGMPLSRAPATSAVPGSAASGYGNTVHDGQLGGWKIPPSQFRPLKAAVEKSVVALRSLAAEGHSGEISVSAENEEMNANFGALLQVLTVLAQ